MRTILALTTAVLCVGAWVGTSQSDESAPDASRQSETKTESAQPASDGKLIVHEWGTFTSFSGSDGLKLEFRPLVDNDLPAFVLDRARQFGLLNPFMKLSLTALQRMETPVMYFYTDREREVRVRVSFPKGLLTEFYPPVESMQPPFRRGSLAPVAKSSLDWGRVWLIPTDRLKSRLDDATLSSRIDQHVLKSILPGAANKNHYVYARETDSALVAVHRKGNKKIPTAPKGDFFEKFLFYRGVGNFRLPLTLESLGQGRFELTNAGTDTIRSLFLVTVDGKQLRYSTYDGIEAGGKLKMAQSQEETSIDELSEAVVKALVGQKLYEKEARAMVKTWRSSWFGEEGTRLFYMVPARLTNTLLPLDIQPAPDEMVRVLVGRMEIMTPEDEARIIDLVRKSAAKRAAVIKNAAGKSRQITTQRMRKWFPPAIRKMGRLAEPALVRVKNITKEAVVRNEADLLLKQLKAKLVLPKRL